MKKHYSVNPSLFILAVLIWISCKKDYPPAPKQSDPTNTEQRSDTFRILVCNEGNFGFGNGSLSMVEFPGGKLTKNVLLQSMPGQSLDVVQSISKWDKHYYLVVNNNQTILKLDETNFSLKDEIKPLVSPRYISYAEQRFWISDLYANAVSVADPVSGTILGTIPFPGWCEEMVSTQDALWVSGPLSDKTYRIDIRNQLVSDSLQTGASSGWICKGKYDEIYVLSAGQGSTGPAIACISDSSRVVVRRFELPFGAGICKKLVFYPVLNRLYFLAGDLYSVKIDGTELRKEYSAGASENLYGLEINSGRNLLLVTDARNYLSDGALLLFDLNRGFSAPQRMDVEKIPGECLIE